ncbi:uncharacterized protein N7459_002205 [Penicillium hispanicum]|uniref:uncharacterized protein n=1 Tax=Penicillium hispanicum TaxID=1080232 RepID=UPI002541EBCD|nr:uncharacterized protein N7459_002205 [Penicillium hispanicum]KAJ5591836.1 hypothetical protein N7459_002205 [Penicillium hispanicum]
MPRLGFVGKKTWALLFTSVMLFFVLPIYLKTSDGRNLPVFHGKPEDGINSKAAKFKELKEDLQSHGISTPIEKDGSNNAVPVIVPHETAEDVAIIAGKTRDDNVDWIFDFCEEFLCTPYIYTMDEDPEENFLLPYSTNGRESSVYLSYMIDYYDQLHPYNIFIHSREEQWHSDIAGPNTRNVLSNLRLDAVSLKGYANLRCSNDLGCPSTMHQKNPLRHDLEYQYLMDELPNLYAHFLGADPSEAPVDIGHQCCAQFAVTSEKIQVRTKEDYLRIMEWIATTDMSDNYGIGWLLEKLWHIFLGMPPV